MPQAYQSLLWASFHSSESFDRVPRGGETLHIRAPAIASKEGGVGFDELQEWLQASDRVDDESESPAPDIMQRVMNSGDATKATSGPRILDIKVERARTYINI
jgi:hypothetical protein